MRTIRIKLYKFNELSKDAKRAAIEQYKEDNSDLQTFDYIFNDAYETTKKFCDLFNIDLDTIDFLEHYRSKYSFRNIEDNVKELTGSRLATWIWNNYKDDLFKGKYYKSWRTDKKVNHRKVTSKIISKATGWSNTEIFGSYWNVYNGLTLEHSCELTGMCYDEDILQPIYETLQRPGTRDCYTDILEECLSNICKTVEKEIEYQFTDQSITDHFEANEYEFTKEGKLS